jgi:hypothetical protein
MWLDRPIDAKEGHLSRILLYQWLATIAFIVVIHDGMSSLVIGNQKLGQD